MEIKINLNDGLKEKLEKQCQSSDFSSIEELASFVITEFVKGQESQTDSQQDSQEAMSEEDEAKVKERLKSLGYLD
jgi:hypothetical protein